MAHRQSGTDRLFRKNRSYLGTLHIPVAGGLSRCILHSKQQGAKHTMEHTEHQQTNHHKPFNSVNFRRLGCNRSQGIKGR